VIQMSAMSYVQKHAKSGVYRIRRALPAAARFAFGGKHEYIQSLYTKNYREAQSAPFPKLAELQRRMESVITRSAVGQNFNIYKNGGSITVWNRRIR
jgi:hypothetical protein